MTSLPHAIFRCDASPVIGAGHVSRCLALAETFSDAGWRISFVVSSETLRTFPGLGTNGFRLHVLDDAASDVGAMRTEAGGTADLIIVDHYGRDAAFEMACRPFARKLLAFDDMTGRRHDCDFVVDAAAKDPDQYRVHTPTRTRVLAGVAYATVRKSFQAARSVALARRDGRRVRNILVSCGATDPANATATVLDVLAEVPAQIAVTVVLSSNAPHADAIRRNLRSQVRLITDAGNMAELMTVADLAIGAPGATSYERAVLGLPSILMTLADNQRGIAAMMLEHGAATDAGCYDSGLALRLRAQVKFLMDNANARQRLSSTASKLIDGRGAMRVMLECADTGVTKHGSSVRLRLAEAQDEMWLLELQQQPSTRRFYRNTAVPSAAEHHEWMKQTLSDPKKLLMMIEVDGGLAGVLRLDRQSGENAKVWRNVSIAIDAGSANRGIGSAALGAIRDILPGAHFRAEISSQNIASQRAFARAGYKQCGINFYQNEGCSSAA